MLVKSAHAAKLVPESSQVKEEGLLAFLRGFFGLTFALASVLLLFFDTTLIRVSAQNSFAGVLDVAVILFVACITCIVLRLLCERITGRTPHLIILAVAIAGLCLAPIGMTIEPLRIVCLPVAAAGIVAASFIWSLYLCNFSHVLLVSLISIALALAAAASATIAALEASSLAMSIIGCVLGAASFALLGVEPRDQASRLLAITAKESKKRAVTVRFDRWTYATIGLDFGFAIGLALLIAGGGSTDQPLATAGSMAGSALMLGAPLALAGIIMLVLRTYFRYVLEDYSKDYLSFCVALLVLPMLVVPHAMQPIFAAVLLLVASCQVIIVISASIEFIRFDELSPAWYMAEQAFVAFGMLVGVLIGGMASAQPLGGAGSTAFVLCSIIVVIANTFTQPMINKGLYPAEPAASAARRSPVVRASAAARSDTAPASPLIADGESDDIVAQDEDAHAEKASMWKVKIDHLAKHYDLTPRQKEIFGFLAKGRDAKFIEDRLCISHSTAKSHIYSIYCKLDIHSRQELIDIVESTVVAGKSGQPKAAQNAGENKGGGRSPNERVERPSVERSNDAALTAPS